MYHNWGILWKITCMYKFTENVLGISLCYFIIMIIFFIITIFLADSYGTTVIEPLSSSPGSVDSFPHSYEARSSPTPIVDHVLVFPPNSSPETWHTDQLGRQEVWVGFLSAEKDASVMKTTTRWQIAGTTVSVRHQGGGYAKGTEFIHCLSLKF